MTDKEMAALAEQWDLEAEVENAALEAEREAEYHADEAAREAFEAQMMDCEKNGHNMVELQEDSVESCLLCGWVE